MARIVNWEVCSRDLGIHGPWALEAEGPLSLKIYRPHTGVIVAHRLEDLPREVLDALPESNVLDDEDK